MQFEVKTWAKFPGTCTECKLNFAVDALVWYHTFRKTMRHVKCPQFELITVECIEYIPWYRNYIGESIRDALKEKEGKNE